MALSPDQRRRLLRMNMLMSYAAFASAKAVAWTPATLFANAEVGGWYDPSDLTTMFQDAAGTTAAALESPVGLIRDKSGRGNHLSQSTSTARPVLSARVNLLTRTEEFDNAAWSLVGIKAFGAGSIANDTLAPNGTSTADYIQEDTSNGQHIVYSQNFSRVGPSFTASICAKAKERSVLLFTLQDAAFGSPPYAIFDLSNGSYTVNSGAYPSNSGATASIVSLGNGWYRCTLSATNYSQANININICISDSTSPTLTSYNRPTYTGDGSSGLYIWGADLRPSNAGVGLPAYQRVGAATSGSSSSAGTADYDATGFPYYLRDDLVDDTINWTAPSGTYTVSFVDRAGNVTIETSQSLSGSTDALRVERLGGYLAINRALTASETASLTAWFKTKVKAPV